MRESPNEEGLRKVNSWKESLLMDPSDRLCGNPLDGTENCLAVLATAKSCLTEVKEIFYSWAQE